MEELKSLLKNNVDGNVSDLQDQIVSVLHNEAEINALITWVKVNSIINRIDGKEVMKEVENISKSI